jgi:hypothetical protein
MANFVDLTGRRFGRLTAIERAIKTPSLNPKRRRVNPLKALVDTL